MSSENVARLFANEPILVDTAELGVTDGPYVLLFAGKDTDALVDQIAGGIGADTVINPPITPAQDILGRSTPDA